MEALETLERGAGRAGPGQGRDRRFLLEPGQFSLPNRGPRSYGDGWSPGPRGAEEKAGGGEAGAGSCGNFSPPVKVSSGLRRR